MPKYFFPTERVCPYCGRTFKPNRMKQVACSSRKCRIKHMNKVVNGKAKRVRFGARLIKPRPQMVIDSEPGW